MITDEPALLPISLGSVANLLSLQVPIYSPGNLLLHSIPCWLRHITYGQEKPPLTGSDPPQADPAKALNQIACSVLPIVRPEKQSENCGCRSEPESG